MLEVKSVTVRYGGLAVVDGVSFRLRENQWLMIAGPNGAGKSTLVNAVSQSIPYGGQVLFRGSNIAAEKPALLAQKIGMLMQSHSASYAFSVEEVVRLGRYAWRQGFLHGQSEQDDEKVEQALQLTGMALHRKQSVLTLSGGELQRAFLAQVLAQDPQLLILDEPANHLDLVYQKQMFDLLAKWVQKPGRAIISVVHDLSLAKAYGSHALLMDKGRPAAQGAVDEVFTNETLNTVYGIDVAAWMRRMLAQWPAVVCEPHSSEGTG